MWIIYHHGTKRIKGCQVQDATTDYIRKIAEELEISIPCATDVWYLRTRSRHTDALEQELIKLHKEGNPPNIYDWP